MPRPALSASRAVQVVNFLAANPDGGYTMSELARELGVNTASMHSVLNVLVRDRYVVRDPGRKRYRLGPGLVAVGQAALDQQPAIRRAREEAAALADRLGLECLAAVVSGTDILIVGEAGRPELLHLRPRVGQRLPFMPPLGILGAGFMPEPDREAWLDRAGPGMTEPEKDAYRAAAAAARARGYEIGLETATRQMIGRLLVELGHDPRSPELLARLTALVGALGREEHQLLEPEPGRTYDVNHVMAPIFGTHRELVAALTLLGFDEPLDGERIADYARILVGTTTGITLATGGRIPLDL